MKWIKEHPYCLLLLYLPCYLAAFFIIDRLPLEHTIIRCPLDDLIPFNQYMIIPYAVWYAWFPGWLLYFLLKSREEFIRLALVMFSGMTISLLIYVIWPNGIDLREPITGTDICSRALILIREADTPYGVCPSIHISSTVAVGIVTVRSKLFARRRWVKVLMVAECLAMCWATLVLQQHSVLDVAAGAALSFALMPIAWKLWPQKE